MAPNDFADCGMRLELYLVFVDATTTDIDWCLI